MKTEEQKCRKCGVVEDIAFKQFLSKEVSAAGWNTAQLWRRPDTLMPQSLQLFGNRLHCSWGGQLLVFAARK
ncbi:hypothetical protein [Leisingera aquimarina]|uniref:hypothetical protein n=1 Tax=Leisingera aquimarina TaxID=476529 RepID=UPI0012EB4538|nr:hypothetical protein [Leisingera aquimarina]